MNELIRNFSLSIAFSIAFAISLVAPAYGQQAADLKYGGSASTAAAANTQTVDARQSGAWNVGIDPTKNAVQVANSADNPLPVKVMSNGRKPFQKRIIVTPLGNGFQTAFMSIPAGKRLVIENVSAIVRCPEGMRMEVNYFTYFDNEGNGDGGIADITFHRFALTDQGSFDGSSIFVANHKVLVFAEEQIGTTHYQVGVQARMNTTLPAGSFVQAQVTFSGYLEDLPVVP